MTIAKETVLPYKGLVVKRLAVFYRKETITLVL